MHQPHKLWWLGHNLTLIALVLWNFDQLRQMAALYPVPDQFL
jgi:hypothetical protein